MTTYTKQFIVQKLQSDNTWLIRGILAIYNLQTDTEQSTGATREHNNVGFNAVDSFILSSFARQSKAWEATPTTRRFRSPLSVKQLEHARKKMKKYAGQLTSLANNA